MEVTGHTNTGISQLTMQTSWSKTIDVAVPSGTYYRVRGYHAASQSGTKESTSTLTQWYHGQIMTIGKGKRKKRRKILISNP